MYTRENEKLFVKLLDLMTVFNQYCEKHDIRYWAAGGTMLGAVRHQGFIPWDDDVDLMMFRNDYNKLKQVILIDPLPEPYFFQNPITDEGYPKGFIRLRNSLTTEIPYGDIPLKCNKGIFIDIFPLDKVAPNTKEQKRAVKKSEFLAKMMNSYARWYSGFGVRDCSGVRKLLYNSLVPLFKLKILTMPKLYKWFENNASKYNAKDLKQCALFVFSGVNHRFVYNIECFSETVYKPFENITIPLPYRYEELLTQSYGDYMIPVKALSEHGELVYSDIIPYGEYIEENKELLMEKWLQLKGLTEKDRKV